MCAMIAMSPTILTDELFPPMLGPVIILLLLSSENTTVFGTNGSDRSASTNGPEVGADNKLEDTELTHWMPPIDYFKAITIYELRFDIIVLESY